MNSMLLLLLIGTSICFYFAQMHVKQLYPVAFVFGGITCVRLAICYPTPFVIPAILICMLVFCLLGFSQREEHWIPKVIGLLLFLSILIFLILCILTNRG